MEITNFIVSGRVKAKDLGNYGTYRTQLSNRIHNLRRKLGLATKPRAKYSTKAPITAEDIARDHEFINLLLLTSERAWAHAMAMREVHAVEKQGITGSARSHIISRLHKATVYATSLFEFLTDQEVTGATLEDVLESRAYAAALRGATYFEKQSWESCVKSYSEARIIYSALATGTKNDLFRDVTVDEVDPSIVFSAYQLKLPRTVAIPTIARKFFPSEDEELVEQVEKLDVDVLNEQPTRVRTEDAGAEAAPKTITWRSRTVDLEHAAIASALAAVKSSEKTLAKTLSTLSATQAKERAAAYDDILISSQDAVDATKSAIDELIGEGVGQGDKRMQSLQITRTAVGYDLISWRIGRNRVLVGSQDGAIIEPPATKDSKKKNQKVQKEEGTGRKLAHLREKIVLYDGILQSLDAVKELPGVAADEKFLEELEAKYEYFTALKSLTIARSHALLSNPKNALALLALASQKSTSSQSYISSQMDTSNSASPPNISISPSEVDSLTSLLEGEVTRYRALVELSNLTETADKKAGNVQVPLIERLNDYGSVEVKNLVTYPPKIEPVPVKPLFFDAAWNYIDYPGREVRSVVEKEEKSEQESGEKSTGQTTQQGGQKKGWFGFGR